MNFPELFSKYKWLMLGRWNHTLLGAELVCSSIVDKNLSNVIKSLPSAYLNINNRQYVPKDDFLAGIEEAQKLFEKNTRETVQQLKSWVLSSGKRLEKFSFKTFDPEMARAYFHALRYHGRQWYEIMLADGALSKLYPASLPEEFRLGNQTFTPQSLLALCALPKKVFPMIQEHRHLLEMTIQAKEKKDISQELDLHVEKYSWMNSLAWWDEPFTHEHYQKEIEKLMKQDPEKEITEREEKRKTQYETAEKLLTLLRKSHPKAWEYIDAIRELADLKEDNWDPVSIAGVRQRSALQDLAKNFFLSYYQFMMLTPKEFLEILEEKRKPDPDELNNRLKGFVSLHMPEKSFLQSGIKIDDFLDLIEDERELSDELQGTVIWQGKVTGQVCVLEIPKHVSKMKKDAILVCPMSDPDYMPAIHMAKAIITDQGGLLCHAAIVARELQIPCIVGTQYATKVFKDGDMVEVDAVKGVVRRIDQ